VVPLFDHVVGALLEKKWNLESFSWKG